MMPEICVNICVCYIYAWKKVLLTRSTTDIKCEKYAEIIMDLFRMPESPEFIYCRCGTFFKKLCLKE